MVRKACSAVLDDGRGLPPGTWSRSGAATAGRPAGGGISGFFLVASQDRLGHTGGILRNSHAGDQCRLVDVQSRGSDGSSARGVFFGGSIDGNALGRARETARG